MSVSPGALDALRIEIGGAESWGKSARDEDLQGAGGGGGLWVVSQTTTTMAATTVARQTEVKRCFCNHREQLLFVCFHAR
ncbi:MAG: hypothetical protein AAGA56_28720, partial [Myxococcota bacterium]